MNHTENTSIRRNRSRFCFWFFILALLIGSLEKPLFAQHSLVDLERASTQLRSTDQSQYLRVFDTYGTSETMEMLLNFCRSQNTVGASALANIARFHANPQVKTEAVRLWLGMQISRANNSRDLPLAQKRTILSDVRLAETQFINEIKVAPTYEELSDYLDAMHEGFRRLVTLTPQSDYGSTGEKIDFNKSAELKKRLPREVITSEAYRLGWEQLQALSVILEELGTHQLEERSPLLEPSRSVVDVERLRNSYMRHMVSLMLYSDFAEYIWPMVDRWIISGRYSLEMVIGVFSLEANCQLLAYQNRAQMVFEALVNLRQRIQSTAQDYRQVVQSLESTTDVQGKAVSMLRDPVFLAANSLAAVELQRNLLEQVTGRKITTAAYAPAVVDLPLTVEQAHNIARMVTGEISATLVFNEPLTARLGSTQRATELLRYIGEGAKFPRIK